MNNFFAFISRMKYINRWSLMRNSYTENIAEHSMMVAAVAHCLALINNRVFGGNINADKLAVRGIYHDAGEVLVGDLPTPVKYYNLDINGSYKALEQIAAKKLVKMLPDELQKDYETIIGVETADYEGKLLKAADKICAYIKCVEEVTSGNNEFKKALATIKLAIDDFKLPEVEYFINNFENSFGKTLDELN
ncbi:MAG: 5'-deoxynucleotidase [Clostridia bacterium]|nr:5'-deoxynucleotidase [Clostridia bacterium]